MTQASGAKVISIGVPIYKRLEYLPHVLQLVAAQDYPAVELVISDNGENGSKVRDFVQKTYLRPYRFRQNPQTVDITTHFNQVIHEATGEYFVMLNDDDEITPNFATELVGLLERHPEAAAAYARQEIINKDGLLLRKSKESLPEILTGPEFIIAMWGRYEFDFDCPESFVSRTKMLKTLGGYPNFTKGNHIDDGAVIRLSLQGSIAFSTKCAFRFRMHDSFGWSVSTAELAAATREFLIFLDSDPVITRYAAQHPAEWERLKNCLDEMAWQTYLHRWQGMYRQRMSYLSWVRAGFALPFIPAYYKKVARILLRSLRPAVSQTPPSPASGPPVSDAVS